MKIKCIQLENFRGFHGKQKIEFSIDDKKNITLIHAENGSGKTAILNSILWCFFEIFTENFKDKKSLINQVALKNGLKLCRVKIEFIYKNKTYFAVRKSELNKPVDFKLSRLERGSLEEIKDPSSFMNSIIPKDISKYFFFQGEGVGTISGAKGGENVKRAVQDILGFSLAKEALRDIQKVKKQYRMELSNADKTGQMSKTQNEIIVLESNICDFNEDLSSYGSSVKEYEEKITTIEEAIANSDSAVIKELHASRVDKKQQLKRAEDDAIRARKEKVRLISDYATTAFGYELSTLAFDFIDEGEYRGRFPENIAEQLVQDILEEKECICGTNVNEGSSAYNKIQKLLEKSSDPNLESRVMRARAQLSSIKRDSRLAKDRFNDNMKLLNESLELIDQLKENLRDVSARIIGTESIEDIKSTEIERTRLKGLHKTDLETYLRIKARKESAEKGLDSLKSEAGRIKGFEPKVQRFKKLIDCAESIESIINETLKNAEKDVELNLALKVNEYMTKYFRQDWKAQMVTGTFEFRLLDKYENKVLGTSNGQDLFLSLSFIMSLLEISSLRSGAKGQILTPGGSAPFVLDSPFGDFDKTYKERMAESIPQSVEQVVFLLSSSQWKDVECILKKRVGKEYILVVEQASNEKTTKVDSTIIDGNEYENVRYSMPIDCTKIEEVASYVE